MNRKFRLWPILIGILTGIVFGLVVKDPFISAASGACCAALLVIIVHVFGSKK